MTPLQSVLYFSFMALLGSTAMCGWYAITRGRIAFHPDGAPYRLGKVFMGWHFFWTQGRKVRTRVEGNALMAAAHQLQQHYGFRHLDLNYEHTALLFRDHEEATRFFTADWQVRHLFGYSVEVGDKEDSFVLYADRFSYRFPWWLRDPLSECVTCYASVYGSALFFLGQVAFGPLPLVTWPLYCVVCAALNNILIKKVL